MHPSIKRLRERRKAAGVCIDCEEPAAPYTRCADCRADECARDKRRRDTRRAALELVQRLGLAVAVLLAMLPADRAALNAATTLSLIGVYGHLPRCIDSDLGWICAVHVPDGYVVLRCSGTHAEVCTGKLVRRP